MASFATVGGVVAVAAEVGTAGKPAAAGAGFIPIVGTPGRAAVGDAPKTGLPGAGVTSPMAGREGIEGAGVGALLAEAGSTEACPEGGW